MDQAQGPRSPQDQDLRNIIDKLAQFVARNGPEFEQMTKTKQKDNPKFSFLFGGEHYHYYTYRVNAEQAIIRQRTTQSPSAAVGGPNYGSPTTGGQWGSQAGGTRPPGWDRPPRWDAGPPTSHPPGPPVYNQPPFAPPAMSATVVPNVSDLKEKIVQLEEQQKTLRVQLEQSEKNLAAQYQVTVQQQDLQRIEAVKKAKWDHLQVLSKDTQIDIEEMETVMHPIIESCTKDSISSGKSWIFLKAVSHDNNQLIAHYLAYRVSQEDAPFSLKLHLIYLMNDVLHHCVRKNNEELKQSFESVAVEMFCSAWVSAKEDQQPKLSKLIKLWEDKTIFSNSTLKKMKATHESWKTYKAQLNEDYSLVISEATKVPQATYDNYKQQHENFAAHANGQIQSLEIQKNKLLEQINQVEASFKAAQQQQHQQAAELNTPREAWGQQQVEGTADSGEVEQREPPSKPKSGRSSRWDSGATPSLPTPNSWMGGPPGSAPPNIRPPGPPGIVIPQGPAMMGYAGPGPGGPPPNFGGPPGHFARPPFPDLSRPPPGFTPQIDEQSLIPSLPYFELPAGLMISMVKMEDSGYKPIDPDKIRLPPPTPPTERLLQALELFYAPPSHERPRDPEGWEMIGLYEWSRDKADAIKRKNEAIEKGEREKSSSPERLSNRSSPDRTPPLEDKKKEQEEEKRDRYAESPDRNGRKRYRSRSRTRSRSRGSTPDRRQRSYSRSPSPTGYAMPSYLTKRSPSPTDNRNSSPRRRRNSPSRRRRSLTPPPGPFIGGGSAASAMADSRLDSSNKGHQMMQKMGWTGSGLGSGESGITEPISGGEVRNRNELYKGVGVGKDPFESFRKAKSGSFHTRMKERSDSRK